jgi:hypothetical protein
MSDLIHSTVFGSVYGGGIRAIGSERSTKGMLIPDLVPDLGTGASLLKPISEVLLGLFFTHLSAILKELVKLLAGDLGEGRADLNCLIFAIFQTIDG